MYNLNNSSYPASAAAGASASAAAAGASATTGGSGSGSGSGSGGGGRTPSFISTTHSGLEMNLAESENRENSEGEERKKPSPNCVNTLELIPL